MKHSSVPDSKVRYMTLLHSPKLATSPLPPPHPFPLLRIMLCWLGVARTQSLRRAIIDERQ